MIYSGDILHSAKNTQYLYIISVNEYDNKFSYVASKGHTEKVHTGTLSFIETLLDDGTYVLLGKKEDFE